TKSPYIITEGIIGETKPNLNHSTGQSQQFTYQAGFDYFNSFRAHNLNLLGVFEARSTNLWDLAAGRRNYNLYMDEINMGSSTSADMTTSGSSSQARQVGLVYRASYDFAGKYMIEASGRYDGHYHFAPENR